jgi:hypothetical protein
MRKDSQMNNGWIKIHRKFIDWQWFGSSEAVHLFIYLTLKANHADKMWQGHEVKRGELITSIGHLSIATGISQRSVRTLLKKFANTGEIEVKTTNKFTIVTICKYECYQLTDEENDKQNVTQTTNKRQTTDKQVTTNKNDKNYKNEKNEENIYRAFDHLEISRPEFDKLVAEGWSPTQVDDILNRIENYKKNKDYKNLYRTAMNWLAKEPKKGTIQTPKVYMVFYKKQNENGKFVNMEISVTDEGLQELKNSGVEIYRIVEPEIKNLGGVVL